MGAVDLGGSGCICPESALLKTLLTHLLFRQEEVLILDMYAGVEHLGRATADFVDAMLVVVEPTRRSLGTAAQIKALAADIGLTRLGLVGNKVRNAEEAAFLEAELPGLPILGMLPADLASARGGPVGSCSLRLCTSSPPGCRRAGGACRGVYPMTITIALAGKGGVGKTTLAALIIKCLAETRPGAILAIDADPSSNLNLVLGMELEWTVGDIREDLLGQVRRSLTAGGQPWALCRAGSPSGSTWIIKFALHWPRAAPMI